MHNHILLFLQSALEGQIFETGISKSFRICKKGKSSGLGWVDRGVHTDLLIQAHEKLPLTLAFGMIIFSRH